MKYNTGKKLLMNKKELIALVKRAHELASTFNIKENTHLLDENDIETKIVSLMFKWEYEQSTYMVMAYELLITLLRKHIFYNANKRTALISFIFFLNINNFNLIYKDDIIDILLILAQSSAGAYADLVNYLDSKLEIKYCDKLNDLDAAEKELMKNEKWTNTLKSLVEL